MDLSIVTTLYGSESTVREFHERITRAASEITGNFEIIMVDDGSPDRSLPPRRASGLAASRRRWS